MRPLRLGTATVVYASLHVGARPTAAGLDAWLKKTARDRDFLQLTHRELAALHAIVVGRRTSTGGGFETIGSWGGSNRTIVLRFRPELVSDFAAIPSGKVGALAGRWAETGPMKSRNQDAEDFLAALRRASRQARAFGQDLHLVLSAFPRRRPFALWSVDSAGRRTRLRACELILRQAAGLQLDINLAPHPSRHDLHFLTLSERTFLTVHPISGNWLDLDAVVGDVTKGRRAPGRVERAPWNVSARDALHRTAPVQASRFVVRLRHGVELEVNLVSRGWRKGRVEIGAPGRRQLRICFGAGNSVWVGA